MGSQDELIGALIGLSRATENTVPTAQTFAAMRKGLRNLDPASEELVSEIREAKFALVPDCRTCMNPCGHNDDYDMRLWHCADAKVQELKNRILSALRRLAEKENDELLRQGLFLLGYADTPEDLQPLAEKMEEML